MGNKKVPILWNPALKANGVMPGGGALLFHRPNECNSCNSPDFVNCPAKISNVPSDGFCKQYLCCIHKCVSRWQQLCGTHK